MKAPRIISTLFYVLMGWIVVIAMVPLLSYMPITGIIWLGAGGLLYTAGAVLYALKIPQKKILGFAFMKSFIYSLLPEVLLIFG